MVYTRALPLQPVFPCLITQVYQECMTFAIQAQRLLQEKTWEGEALLLILITYSRTSRRYNRTHLQAVLVHKNERFAILPTTRIDSTPAWQDVNPATDLRLLTRQ